MLLVLVWDPDGRRPLNYVDYLFKAPDLVATC